MTYERENRTAYQYGAAARNYEPQRRVDIPDEKPVRRPQQPPRTIRRGNVLGAALLTVVFAICAVTMVNYVQLTSELTGMNKTVAAKRVELNELKSQNDANYSRVLSSVDLQEIEEIARVELGMTYAQEGQVYLYSAAGNDYMRKVDSSNE